MEVQFTHERDNCDTEMTYTLLVRGDGNKIPLGSLGQLHLVCQNCELNHYTDDMQILNENEL